MTRGLQRTTAHLAAGRRTILAHAAATALAGLLPIPYLEEQLPALVRRAMIRKIAAARHVDLDDDAVREIAEGRVPRPGWRSLIGLGSLWRTARRSVRRAFIAYSVYRRTEVASRTFALGTLFDHYCAQHHVGVGLDATQARALRERMDIAIASRGGSLGGYLFRQGFTAALRGAVRAPLELATALTWGRWKRLRGRPRPDELPQADVRRDEVTDEVEAEELVETTIDAELAEGTTFLARTVRAVDRQISSLGNGWLDGLLAAFEETR